MRHPKHRRGPKAFEDADRMDLLDLARTRTQGRLSDILSVFLTWITRAREAWAEMPLWVRGRLWAVSRGHVLKRASVGDGLKPYVSAQRGSNKH